MFAIRLHLGAEYYYGWIHALAGYTTETNPRKTITIDKYAFCKIPNYPLHLGQTEIITGISPINTPDSTSVYLTNSGNNLNVTSGKTIKNVTLTSANGVVVASQYNINGVSANLNIANIAHGAYIVQVTFNDLSSFAKQIVK